MADSIRMPPPEFIYHNKNNSDTSCDSTAKTPSINTSTESAAALEIHNSLQVFVI